MAAITTCSHFGDQKNKVWHCFHCFPIYFYFLQFKSEFGNKEFMIWATVSSLSCFYWLYRASPSLAAKYMINLISVLTIWWCLCVESSLVLLEAKPMLHNYWVCALEPGSAATKSVCHTTEAGVPQSPCSSTRKTTTSSASKLESCPHSQQLQKVHKQQGRPSAAKN